MASRFLRRKPCVLIVDDDSDVREFMRDVISAWHCKALTAASGPEALDILERWRVDVVLLDVVMPTMDGVETLLEIKRRMSELPVIMMSAMLNPDLREYLAHTGAQCCLSKPIERKELARALVPWCAPGGQAAKQ